MKSENLLLKIKDDIGLVSKHVFYKDELDKLVPHYHDGYEILMVLSPECIIGVEGKTQILHKYDICICAPNQVHTMAKRFSNHEHYFTNFTGEYIDVDLQLEVNKLCTKGKYTPRAEDIPLLLNEFANLCDSNAVENKYKKKWYKTSINRILITMLSNNLDLKNDNDQTETSIDTVVEYINKNYASDLELDSVAEMCHMAPTYLSRIFKKNVGMGFKDYIIMVRINEAKRLLIMTKESVSNISIDCGFNDSNYFSSVFKARVGITPLQFRSKYGQIL